MSGHALSGTDIGFQALMRAWSDERFKRALMRDSRGALREYFGYDVPEGEALVVTEGAAAAAAQEASKRAAPSARALDLEDGRVEISADPGKIRPKGYVCCLCC